MKLNIFLVLLTVFLLSCLGSNIQEGFGIVQDMGNLGGDVGRAVGNVVGGVGVQRRVVRRERFRAKHAQCWCSDGASLSSAV